MNESIAANHVMKNDTMKVPMVNDMMMGHDIFPSPFKQFKNGALAQDVKCRGSFSLVFKASDGSPACVSPQTALSLVARGWGAIAT